MYVVCVVTEVSTFLIITQVSNDFKKSHILIFSKCKYFHVKIASLGTVKSCVTIGPICDGNVWPCLVSVDYLSGLVLKLNILQQ